MKTTVYLDPDDYRRLKAIAKVRKQAPAALVREAVAEFAERHRPRRLPRSIGIARSGRGDISSRAEELLKGMGQ